MSKPNELHKNYLNYVPDIIAHASDDYLSANRQMLMQLFDKQLISRRTLLAAFTIDADAEDAEFAREDAAAQAEFAAQEAAWAAEEEAFEKSLNGGTDPQGGETDTQV